MMHKCITVILALVMTACVSDGNQVSPGDNSKSGYKGLFSVWTHPVSGMTLNLTGARFQPLNAVKVPIVGGQCDCALDLSGTELSGEIKLHACGFQPVGCENYYILGLYTVNAGVLRICNPSGGSCQNWN